MRDPIFAQVRDEELFDLVGIEAFRSTGAAYPVAFQNLPDVFSETSGAPPQGGKILGNDVRARAAH
jgi:hypothetical protein